MKKNCILLMICMGTFSFLHAKLSTPSIIGSNMVLQRGQSCPIWGWASPNAYINLIFAGKTYQTKANQQGGWRIKLDPLEASFKQQTMIIAEGRSNGFSRVRKNFSIQLKNQPGALIYENILVGEVWLCSGQSNMQWGVSSSDDSDLETLSANYPNIRLISVPQVGTQVPQKDFEGSWEAVNKQSSASFSAVGYYFGRRLHQILQVPVGLIDNSWGGSACEAWIPKDRLMIHPIAQPYMMEWREKERNYDFDALTKSYFEKLAKWKAEKANGSTSRPPRAPRNLMTGQHRPGNLFNGVLHPIIGYGIKGAIWYQGESNAGRAFAYREIFPLMVQSWRQAWGQGDFSFYWTQLADFRPESIVPNDSSWAELRESQTICLRKLNHTGEAVIIDTGEGRDIHPRNKQTVANRLLRHALAKDYGQKIPYESPKYKSMEIKGSKIIINFNHAGAGLYCFDSKAPTGFAICGEDLKFAWASAKLIGKDRVEVWADSITAPIAVRYAWADNPVCNLYLRDGGVTLPVTPFRTDSFPLTTMGK